MINSELVDERHPVVHIVVDAIVEALTHVRQHPVSRGQIFVTCKGSHFEGLNHYEARYFVYGIKTHRWTGTGYCPCICDIDSDIT